MASQEKGDVSISMNFDTSPNTKKRSDMPVAAYRFFWLKNLMARTFLADSMQSGAEVEGAVGAEIDRDGLASR